MKETTRWRRCSPMPGSKRRQSEPKEEIIMRTKIAVLGGGFAILAAAMPMWAHHAFSAEFDANKPIRLQGTVTQMEWINPHAWIHIDVKGADGKTVNWM